MLLSVFWVRPLGQVWLGCRVEVWGGALLNCSFLLCAVVPNLNCKPQTPEPKTLNP